LLPSRPLRLSCIVIMTLSAILISSAVIAVYSSSPLAPMFLKVGFASATTSSENGEDDESNTDDATTDDGGEDGDEQQEQFATVVGEICDDLVDNDGDGWIDIEDVLDCAAPATEGALAAPTAPPPEGPPPPPTFTTTPNTTATNSTGNTGLGPATQGALTAPTAPPPEGPPPPPTFTDTNYVTYPEGIEVNDIDIECQTYEELGLDPPLPSPGDPPNLVWFDCSGVSIPVVPTGNTTSTRRTRRTRTTTPSFSCNTTKYYITLRRVSTWIRESRE
jgi:hypothetical protein